MTTDASYKRQRASGALAGSYDAIVIGSGAGGLTTAALLATEGKRTLVLERHAVAGGCTQVFKRNGFEWDAGLHYMGEVHRRSSGLARLFDRVTGGRLDWAPMPDVYNRIVIGERVYDYVSGTERFKERMKSYFPREAAAIDAYVDLIMGANRAARAHFANRALPQDMISAERASAGAAFLDYSRRTVLEVLGDLTSDQELIAVLCGHYGDYALLPSMASFAVHAMVIKHYIEGASYPVGGSGRIAETISETIHDGGGCILVAAEVRRIVVRKGVAVGVEMADGEIIEAPAIISAAGIDQTLDMLADEDAPDVAGLKANSRTLRPSQCYVMLNIGLSASNDELGMDPANLWAHPGADLVANWERFAQSPSNRPMPLHFISQPSAKDPSWPARYPGRSTIDICSLSHWDLFAPFAGSDWKRRSAEYEELKARLTADMLAEVDRFYPQTHGKVVHAELATPLSFNHFLGRRHGDFMSYAQTPERFAQGWMRGPGPVRGLYFSGQDVAGAGVSGAMVGGLIAASAVLGKDLFQALRG
ncbi:MAG: NAD(P)/FAD-dependent oxidoreductase [Bradyrhizobium sp.]